jgi:hypothetical protein
MNYKGTMTDKIPFVETSVHGFTSGQLTLVLRNIGDGPALINRLFIADEEIGIGKVSIAAGETSEIKVNLQAKKIVNSNVENPKILLTYKNLEGKEFTTSASIEQTPRADGKFNVGRIEGCEPATIKNEASLIDRDDTSSYAVVLSYASEDREYVEGVYNALKREGVNAFFDRDKGVEIEMWGSNLLGYLQEIFGKGKAQYCVIFVSPVYQKKVFTRYELENAMADKILNDKKDYILPVMLEGSELPAPITPTTKYLDARDGKISPEQLAKMIMVKIGKQAHQTEDPKKVTAYKLPRIPKVNPDPDSEPEKVVEYLVKEIKGRGDQLTGHGISLTAHKQEGRQIIKLSRDGKGFFHLAIWLGGMTGGDDICLFQWGDINTSGNNSMSAFGGVNWNKERNAYVVDLLNIGLFREMGQKYQVTPSELVDKIWEKIIEEIEYEYENSRR